MKGTREMKSQRINSTNSSLYLRAMAFLLAAVCVLGCSGRSVRAADSETQTTFASPAEAGQALQVESWAQDKNALTHIFGPRSSTIVNSGDPAEDKAALQSFVTKYDRMNRWVTMTDGSRILYIGSDNYVFPIPLVQDSSSSSTSTRQPAKERSSRAELGEMSFWQSMLLRRLEMQRSFTSKGHAYTRRRSSVGRDFRMACTGMFRAARLQVHLAG
jgi:hypothetical protein